MLEEKTIEEFKEIVAQYGGGKDPSEITEDLRFREDMEFTSLDFMQFLGELEDTFDVEVDETEALKITTVGEAMGYLEELLEK